MDKNVQLTWDRNAQSRNLTIEIIDQKARIVEVCVCFVGIFEASCYDHKQNAPPLLNTTFTQELITMREEYTPIKITQMEIYKEKDIHPRKNPNIISID
jgi:hypothetical protein